jgi:hypothetical protein
MNNKSKHCYESSRPGDLLLPKKEMAEVQAGGSKVDKCY